MADSVSDDPDELDEDDLEPEPLPEPLSDRPAEADDAVDPEERVRRRFSVEHRERWLRSPHSVADFAEEERLRFRRTS